MEEGDETDQEIDLEIDGEDQEVGLRVIGDGEGHIQEADLEATKDQEEEIHAVDLEVKGKDPPPETETDQDLNPNLVPDQDHARFPDRDHARFPDQDRVQLRGQNRALDPSLCKVKDQGLPDLEVDRDQLVVILYSIVYCIIRSSHLKIRE